MTRLQRLREKLQDMTASESKRRRRDEEANAIGASWSPAFKSQVRSRAGLSNEIGNLLLAFW